MFRICKILVRIWILRSLRLTNGSADLNPVTDTAPDPPDAKQTKNCLGFCILLFEGTFT
jgi:hypothetical protein